jgi:CrcB protein
MNVLYVALGAAVGAPLRFLTDRTLKGWFPGRFPWGTFAVNMVGSFILGLVTAAASPAVATLAGTGFCGALTTYSTFSYETVGLAEGGNRLLGTVNVVGSVLLGLAAALAGWTVGGGHL